jgi:pimeloyl-ACP methyl ester carboxylesterase
MGQRLLFGALALAAAVSVHAESPYLVLPAVIYTDPPADPKYPASSQAVQFESHGSLINGQLYRPVGKGAHPTVLLLHGLPGNEQNLDLAQVIRRAGWTAITFHYRGSWGSGGRYSFAGGIEDARALLALLQQPSKAEAWGVDPAHLVIIGHSYGGYVAAQIGSESASVLGVGLIAPWDISFDARAWTALSAAQRRTAGIATFDDVDGRLVGADARSLTDAVLHDGARFDLSRLAASLAVKPLLIVTATRDDADDQAAGLQAGLLQAHAEHVVVRVLASDHSFNDQRIALQVAVYRWLASLPGAPD